MTAAPRPPAVRVRGLGKQYELVTALTEVTFTAAAGAVTAIVGPTGAGKSTLLDMVLGLQKPGSGTVSVGGPGSGIRGVGAVLTPRGLHPGRTVHDQLAVYAPAARASRARVAELLELLGLLAHAAKPVAELSEGEQTRLALAVALLADPQLLVLDAIDNGLTPSERSGVLDIARAHARRGGTVLLSATSLASVVTAADHLVVLSEGAVVWQGTPERLRRGHPDRLVVSAAPPIALATMLASEGFTDAVMRPDGRLAVAEATEAQIRAAADRAQVRLSGIVADPIHPDRVLASLTTPRRPEVPAYAAAAPTTTGMPR